MLTRKLDEARDAWKNKDVEATRRAHDGGRVPQSGSAEEKHTTGSGKYIKSVIYGGLDGTITTFAAVAGVAGASLSPGVVLIMGLANLLADGLSMSIGDYLSSKSQKEYEAAERAREAWEVENYPEGEKRELVEIYGERGMSDEDARAVVEIVAKDRKSWVDTMMVEELGIISSDESPMKNALATFASFALFGFLPISAYVLGMFIPAVAAIRFPLACILTAATLFGHGALKTAVTAKKWYVSGLEMLLVGSVAAIAAYLVGMLLGGLA
ncbi:MAG: VIT1/CCC1 transporter family protein [Spirochaetaceae bacterium]|nr:VIT1/CCC1 transporter family protein [Spirochaetaceae bacterium]